MKKLLLLMLAISLAGCGSANRQIFKARQIFDKYPNEAAKYCGDKFPVADSIVSIKSDTTRGKAIDYMPAISNLKQGLDSAEEISEQKQGKITDLVGQLSFAQTQLSKENNLINSLYLQISSIKASYKPFGVDTIKNTYTKTRANTAKILTLTTQIIQYAQDKKKLQNTLHDEKTRSAHLLCWIIGLSLLIASYFGVKVYNLFTGEAIVGVAKGLL